MFDKLVILLGNNVLLGNMGGEVNAVVKVPTPEHVVMGFQTYTLGPREMESRLH